MGWRLSEEVWKVSSQARVMGLGICPLHSHTLLHVTMCLLHNYADNVCGAQGPLKLELQL